MKFWNKLSRASKIVFSLYTIYALCMLFSGKSGVNFFQWFVIWIFGCFFFVGIVQIISMCMKKDRIKTLEYYKKNFYRLSDADKLKYMELLMPLSNQLPALSNNISHTTDLRVFVNSYRKLLNNLKILSQHDFTGFFKDSLPSESLIFYQEHKAEIEILFIKRTFRAINKEILCDRKYSSYFSFFSKESIEFIETGNEPDPSINTNRNYINYDYMDGHNFEYYCAELLRKNGFENVEVTKGSGDQGIDIIAYKDGIKYGIQCKCYASDIGNKAVQEAFSGKTFYNCHVAAVLTNRYFTASAKELAEKNGVLLWDRDKLNRMIEKQDLSSHNIL